MLAIQNYGHLWARDLIFWGWQKVDGHLDGSRGNKIGHFRNQIGVYVLYNPDLHPIYVGQAGYGEQSKRYLFQRLKDHTESRTRDHWKFFSWFGMRAVTGNGTLSKFHKPSTGLYSKTIRHGLDEIEAVLIEVLNPRSNRRGPNWGSVKRYEQVIDERLVDVDSYDPLFQEIRALRRKLRDLEEEWSD